MTSPAPRVAIIGTRGYPSYYGGFETAVRKLSPFLVEAGWDVTVYSRPGQTQENDPDRDHRVKVVETVGIDTTSLSTLSYGLSAVLHCLVRRPDVALVMNVANGFWLPLLRLRRIRVVVNVDGIEWHRAKWSRAGKLMFKAGAWLTAKFAHELVVDAEAIGKYWEQALGRTGTFLPYGGDTKPQLDEPPGLTRGTYVLAVARFVPENTLPELLEAARSLAEQHDVVLVGSAPEGTPLHVAATSLAESFPRVHWLGHVNDDDLLFSLWQHAGVYFHGHSVGGTNPALVQALALGVPIVARDTVYNREVLADLARFTAATPHDITAAVLKELADPTASAEQRIQRAVERYSWSGVCSGYERLLRSQLRR
ncbi:DUF1972 domain-containing protein [Aeromicrobium sp.]|uniref:DUF1972 domain-containing protein n=1 Tax=Aeromicrobium sp. TaxID=1871063 RepID=UPI003518EA17